MKTLSLREFVDFCQSKNITRYIYKTENQEDDSKYGHAFLELRFSSMLVSETGHTMCFGVREQPSQLQLILVRNITIVQTNSYWTVFRVNCKNIDSRKADSGFVFVAQ